jgi:hypothetical protein
MTQPAVDLKGVTLTYGSFVAVKNVDLKIDKGEPILQASPSPVAKQWERVPEGRVRALGFSKEYSLRSAYISRKSPHPAFGHLLPCCAREKGNTFVASS